MTKDSPPLEVCQTLFPLSKAGGFELQEQIVKPYLDAASAYRLELPKAEASAHLLRACEHQGMAYIVSSVW